MKDSDFPVLDRDERKQLIRQNICPECGRDLDTGWECTDYDRCGFDGLKEGK